MDNKERWVCSSCSWVNYGNTRCGNCMTRPGILREVSKIVTLSNIITSPHSHNYKKKSKLNKRLSSGQGVQLNSDGTSWG